MLCVDDRVVIRSRGSNLRGCGVIDSWYGEGSERLTLMGCVSTNDSKLKC